jgi:hypothetical protein
MLTDKALHFQPDFPCLQVHQEAHDPVVVLQDFPTAPPLALWSRNVKPPTCLPEHPLLAPVAQESALRVCVPQALVLRASVHQVVPSPVALLLASSKRNKAYEGFTQRPGRSIGGGESAVGIANVFSDLFESRFGVSLYILGTMCFRHMRCAYGRSLFHSSIALAALGHCTHKSLNLNLRFFMTTSKFITLHQPPCGRTCLASPWLDTVDVADS